MDSEAIQKLRDEVKALGTDEGAARFIALHTGLSYDRVLHIYRLGEPWLAGFGEGELDFEQRAKEVGVDLYTYMAGIAPLVNLDIEKKEAKLEAYKEALKRGETPDPIPELDNPALNAHLEKVATITGEPLEVIRAVCGGVIDLCSRVTELAQQASALAQADT